MMYEDVVSIVKRVISYVLVAAVAATAAFLFGYSRTKQAVYTSNAVIPVEEDNKLRLIMDVIDESFIGEADENKLIEAAAKAIVAATGDEWSYYMTAEEYKQYQKNTANATEGIGVTIDTDNIASGFPIKSVDEGGGAANAGLQVGDVITHVNGQKMVGKEFAELRNAIVGEKGSTVELTILRDGQSMDVTVARGAVELKVADGKLLPNEIGLVTIYNFNGRCADETISIIEDLRTQGAKALILDVRNNPGGYKSELVKLLDYLLPEGKLFISQSYDGTSATDTSDAACLEMPMAVLINKQSISAAEFFGAALAEYNWAVTVGEHTDGKGYFQTTLPLSDGSAILLSSGKYYTPNGVSLVETMGIAPMKEVLLVGEQAKLLAAGELLPENDPQVQAAVNVLLEKLN